MESVPDNWVIICSLHNAVNFGDHPVANIYVISFLQTSHEDIPKDSISSARFPEEEKFENLKVDKPYSDDGGSHESS